MTRQFLARGDGTTTSFTLPNADYYPSSFQVYLGAVTTTAVVHGTLNGQDPVAYYQTFLKVSNTPDGPAAYTQGADWSHNSDYANNLIDWSLPGQEPAVGATYYVTSADVFQAAATSAYTLHGTTLTFATPPAANQAIFVEYVYGQPTATTLGYQQTHAGDGGFNNILIDSGYTARYLGRQVASGYDWLYDYAGFNATFKAQVAAMLVRWFNYEMSSGYNHDSAASNYGAGGYVGDMFTALALNGRDPNGPSLVTQMTAWRTAHLVPLLSGTMPSGTGSEAGGFWAEGWNYGALATQNLLVAGLAYQDAGLGSDAVEAAWASQVIDELIQLQPTPTTVYDGGDWYAYPAPFPAKSLLAVLSALADNPTAAGYANYLLQNGPGATSPDAVDLLFRNPQAPALNWTSGANVAPLQSLASGTGLVAARADWSYQSTWLTFQVGNLVQADHQTYAPGMLELQRGGDGLLINAAALSGNQDIHTKSSFSNLVVINGTLGVDQNYANNMGFWYGTPGVAMTNYEAAASYVYAGGDYRAAYSFNQNPGGGGPATQLTRQVVYLRPDYVIVHDRVGTVQASYAKMLQWTTLNAPTVSGNSWVATAGSSKLFGETFSSQPLTTVATTADDDGTTINEIHTQNANPTLNVSYTTALQTAPSTTGSMVATSAVTSTDGRMEGVQMGNQVVLFGTQGPVLGTLLSPLSYSIQATGPTTHLLVDLTPGQTYQVQVNGSPLTTVTASSQGTLSFTTSGSGTQNVVIQ
jgi:hypothetical protein